tara:strand:- start:42030 stop:42383 length:354 start_codon:yes stop_codon:yes gene_type:complete
MVLAPPGVELVGMRLRRFGTHDARKRRVSWAILAGHSYANVRSEISPTAEALALGKLDVGDRQERAGVVALVDLDGNDYLDLFHWEAPQSAHMSAAMMSQDQTTPAAVCFTSASVRP